MCRSADWLIELYVCLCVSVCVSVICCNTPPQTKTPTHIQHPNTCTHMCVCQSNKPGAWRLQHPTHPKITPTHTQPLLKRNVSYTPPQTNTHTPKQTDIHTPHTHFTKKQTCQPPTPPPGAWHLLDGDKMAALAAAFLMGELQHLPPPDSKG